MHGIRKYALDDLRRWHRQACNVNATMTAEAINREIARRFGETQAAA